jgi:hypothetical protein
MVLIDLSVLKRGLLHKHFDKLSLRMALPLNKDLKIGGGGLLMKRLLEEIKRQ